MSLKLRNGIAFLYREIASLNLPMVYKPIPLETSDSPLIFDFKFKL